MLFSPVFAITEPRRIVLNPLRHFLSLRSTALSASRRYHFRGSSAGDSRPTAPCSLTSLESALTKNRPITHLESALTNSLDLKSFRIRTYEKRRGEGCKRLTSLSPADFFPEGSRWSSLTNRQSRPALQRSRISNIQSIL